MAHAYKIECEECGFHTVDADAAPTKCPSCDAAPKSVRRTVIAVAVYLIDRAYGGPEEGGWYYDCGERIKDRKVYTCHSKEKAYELASKINASLDANENEGRPSISSVLSQGRYRAKTFEGDAPDYFPTEPQFYC